MSDPEFHLLSGAARPVAAISHSVEGVGWATLSEQMSIDPQAPLQESTLAQVWRLT